MIAVYGGSFNPITVAHMSIINKLISLDYIDKVIILPVGNNYDKAGLVPFSYRKEMIELVIDNDKVVVDNLESNKQLKTYESLSILSEKYKTNDIAFVMGYDNLLDFKNWSNYESILKDFNLIVFNRDNSDINEFLKNDHIFKSYVHKIFIEDVSIKQGISSTAVRNLIKTGHVYNNYLHINVSNYIKNKKLYC